MTGADSISFFLIWTDKLLVYFEDICYLRTALQLSLWRLSRPVPFVTTGRFSLYVPRQRQRIPVSGARDRNIAEVSKVAQLPFLAPDEDTLNDIRLDAH